MLLPQTTFNSFNSMIGICFNQPSLLMMPALFLSKGTKICSGTLQSPNQECSRMESVARRASECCMGK